MRVAIVGAGIGGLSAACHLAGRGHDVTVIERENRPGGRAGLLELGGYRFDTGPTVLTMPDIVRATTEAAGVAMDDVLSLRRVDPTYRAVFADGTQLRVRAGHEAMRDEITAFANSREADAFDDFARWLTELYRVEMANFIDVDFDSPLGILRHPLAMARLVQLGGFGKLAAKVEATFTDERLRRIFSFQAMYAGLSPLDALAIYGVISYMDTIAGVYFPVGGMHAVPRALAEAAAKAGTRFRYGEPVDRLSRSPGGRVDGVYLAGGELVDADVVVVNADAATAYRLAGADIPRRIRHGQYSPSCTVWLAGMKAAPTTDAAHHNIHFGREWKGAFTALLDRGERMPDPSIMVTLPTHSDPGLAPEGRHIVYALEPVPNLEGTVAWRTERARARDDLARHVAELGYGDTEAVEVEHFTDPLDWQAAGMERGTPFALAHTFLQSGPFRPSTKALRVPGMVLVGSTTRPGVGVPMVLLSGRLAADRAERVGRKA